MVCQAFFCMIFYVKRNLNCPPYARSELSIETKRLCHFDEQSEEKSSEAKSDLAKRKCFSHYAHAGFLAYLLKVIRSE